VEQKETIFSTQPFILFKLFFDWVGPTHFGESNLLCQPTTADDNLITKHPDRHIQKNPNNQIFGYFVALLGCHMKSTITWKTKEKKGIKDNFIFPTLDLCKNYGFINSKDNMQGRMNLRHR
jgi:hypothetical protein